MKTNNLKSILLLSMLLIASSLQAQDLFRVMATKGGVQFAKTSSKDVKNVVTGQKLYSDESLTIPAGGYVALVHKSGKTIELKQPGSFNVADVSAKVSANNVSFSQKYSEYVMNELTKGDKADINANHRANSKVTGSVERDVTLNKPLLRVFLPHNADVISNVHTITWTSAAKSATYVLTISNMFSEQLYTTETQDTTYKLDLSKFNSGTDKTILFKVVVKGAANPDNKEFSIKLLDGDKASDLRTKENQVKAELGNEPSSVNSLILASFYEQNNLLVDAENSYEDAIHLEPEVPEYREAYVNFLVRSGIVTVKK